MSKYDFYPNEGEITAWLDEIYESAQNIKFEVEVRSHKTPHPIADFYFFQTIKTLKFKPEDMPEFYAYWSPVLYGPAPLAVQVPGYGAELCGGNTLTADGINTLYISPLGYCDGEICVDELKVDGYFPVLPDTPLTDAKRGYHDWLLEASIAIRWALEQKSVINDRISFFGTSQGGGGALLLGSLYSGRGTRCVAAEEPFLTDFPTADFRGAYHILKRAYDKLGDTEAYWKPLGYVDTLSHTFRMNYPILLMTGDKDTACPPETVHNLHKKLDCTKIMMDVKGRVHGYGYEFFHMAKQWMKMYG